MSWRKRIAACAAFAILGVACAAERTTVDRSLRAAIHDDALRVYSRALIWSPEDSDSMAPLFIVEQVEAKAIDEENPIELQLAVQKLEHSELSLTRRDYRWSFSDGRGGAIRGLYGEDGFPLLYEVLNDSRDIRRVFVSTELESEAAAEFGEILEGRRFAVERSVEEAGRTVVAGEFESGSMPLGPIVYLDAAHRDVTAVICRCMPSQVESIENARRYTLKAIEEMSAFGLENYPDLLRLPTALRHRLRRR